MSDSVGSVSVEVVPDARGWAEKLRAQIRDQSVEVKANADTTEAETQLDEVARTRTAKIKADTSQLSRGANALDDFVGKLGLLPSLAITAGSALIPLAATLGGVVAALAAPLAIGGGGATLFAFLGGAAIKQTLTQSKQVEQLHKSVLAAQTSLEGAQRSAGKHASTSTAVANAHERLAKATAAYQTALKGISPQQQKFVTALDGLKAKFQDFLGGKNGQALLGPFTQGIGILTNLLPIASPLIKDVSGAVTTLLNGVSRSAGSDGFKHFVDQFGRLASRDIVVGGHILGDLARGVGGLLAVTDKRFSGDFLHGIQSLTSNFADWANSRAGRRDVRDFFDYVHRVGPQVADTVGAIARGVGHLVKALAPLGPPVLHVIQGMADAFSSIPIPVLTGLATASAGLVAFQKVGGFKVAGFLTKGLGGGSGGVGGILSAGVQKVFVVNMGTPGLGGIGGGGIAGAGGKTATVAEEAAAGGLLARLGFRGGLGGLLDAVLAAPAGITLGDAGNEVRPTPPIAGPNRTRRFLDQGFLKEFGPNASGVGGRVVPDAGVLKQFGLTSDQARNLLHLPELTSTGTALDSLRQRAQHASQTIDQIGPNAHAAFSSATHDVAQFNGVLNGIRDKKLAIILNDQAAIRSLEALQAYRIHDKAFNVYQRSQLIDQAVGPGGGRGRISGGSGGGAGGGSSVHIHLDESGRTTLTGYVRDHAQGVYDDNQRFQGAHG